MKCRKVPERHSVTFLTLPIRDIQDDRQRIGARTPQRTEGAKAVLDRRNHTEGLVTTRAPMAVLRELGPLREF